MTSTVSFKMFQDVSSQRLQAIFEGLGRGIYGDRLVCQADLKKLRQLTEKISKQMWHGSG